MVFSATQQAPIAQDLRTNTIYGIGEWHLSLPMAVQWEICLSPKLIKVPTGFGYSIQVENRDNCITGSKSGKPTTSIIVFTVLYRPAQNGISSSLKSGGGESKGRGFAPSGVICRSIQRLAKWSASSWVWALWTGITHSPVALQTWTQNTGLASIIQPR